jgi:hypothetical protein
MTLQERGDALPCVRPPALNRILLLDFVKVVFLRNGGWHWLFTIGQWRKWIGSKLKRFPETENPRISKPDCQEQADL